jgi:hypothetical protein
MLNIGEKIRKLDAVQCHRFKGADPCELYIP